MIPQGQLDYLRDVQQTFAHGSGRLDVFGVFSMILIFVVPVVVLAALWYYRRYLWFFIVRFFTRLFLFRTQGIIENYLVSKGVIIEISILNKDGTIGRNIGHARIETVYSGKMTLEMVKSPPTRAELRGKRVLCFVKQFALRGRKYNSFVSYVYKFERKGTMLKKLVLLTPMRYRFTIRRKHVRKRVNRADIIRVKVWSIDKRRNFASKRPDIYTVPDPSRYKDRTHLTVGNISPGGIRLYVHNPRSALPSLRVNDQLVLRISIKDPESRQFFYFSVIGTIRTNFKAKGKTVGLGVQFTSLGEKMPDGSGRYNWSGVTREIKVLKEFLDKFK